MTQAQAFFLQMIYPNVDSGYGILNSLPFFSPQVWSLISSAPVFSSLIPSQWLVMSASGHNSLWTTRWLHLSSGSSLHFVIQSQTSMKHPLCTRHCVQDWGYSKNKRPSQPLWHVHAIDSVLLLAFLHCLFLHPCLKCWFKLNNNNKTRRKAGAEKSRSRILERARLECGLGSHRSCFVPAAQRGMRLPRERVQSRGTQRLDLQLRGLCWAYTEFLKSSKLVITI